MYVCLCNAVTEREVRACAALGIRTLDDLSFHLGVGAGCGRCRECAAEVLRDACTECGECCAEAPPA